jgi:hypothetical protein
VYRDLLAHSPLLALPLVALFIFFFVFVAIIARTMAKRAPAYAPAADLPLREENRHEHE